MTTMQVNANESYDFGYFWWIDKKRAIHFMWGVGGQFAFIVPDKNLVVIITSFPNTAGEYEIQADEALPIVDLIIDAKGKLFLPDLLIVMHMEILLKHRSLITSPQWV